MKQYPEDIQENDSAKKPMDNQELMQLTQMVNLYARESRLFERYNDIYSMTMLIIDGLSKAFALAMSGRERFGIRKMTAEVAAHYLKDQENKKDKLSEEQVKALSYGFAAQNTIDEVLAEVFVHILAVAGQNEIDYFLKCRPYEEKDYKNASTLQDYMTALIQVLTNYNESTLITTRVAVFHMQGICQIFNVDLRYNARAYLEYAHASKRSYMRPVEENKE
ncbi:hypothetical protein [uncultured Bacteroides sp.]|uniref:hypothetical protein n=1 Tax=uncultured Bacteroides sp. TaxID=162156 RepID=UPI002AAB1E49|nr:hypothetical protein [uncultured Bacteroides sp.]